MSFTVEQHIAAAWVLDRADRYPNDSPVRAALDEIMAGLANGEHLRAAEHGELDDILRVPFIRVAEDAQTAAFVAWLRERADGMSGTSFGEHARGVLLRAADAYERGEEKRMADIECPRCGSRAPHLHPAVQAGGEVSPCWHPFHKRQTPENTPERIREAQAHAADAYEAHAGCICHETVVGKDTCPVHGKPHEAHAKEQGR